MVWLCVVFLGKTLHSYGASLHPGVQIGIRKFNAGGRGRGGGGGVGNPGLMGPLKAGFH